MQAATCVTVVVDISITQELPSDAKSDNSTPTASPKPPMTPESESSKVTEAPGQPSVVQTSEEHTEPQTVEARASTTGLWDNVKAAIALLHY